MQKIISHSKKYGESIITSLFWYHDFIDSNIKQAAKLENIKYVDISKFGNNNQYKAIGQFEHQGICGHPNNLGMQKIAEEILKNIKL